MALFKILRGSSEGFTKDLWRDKIYPPFHDGYCYFLTDTGLFYIDYDEDPEGELPTEYVQAIGDLLEEGRKYYLFNGTDYELYTGSLRLLEEFGSRENIPPIYYVKERRHRVPLNSKQTNAIQEINRGLDQKFWRGTKAEYDEIPDKDDDVLYIITDEFEVIEREFMKDEVYDPQGIQKDIFEYADRPRNSFILIDEVNGKNYRIKMVNGNLVSEPVET